MLHVHTSGSLSIQPGGGLFHSAGRDPRAMDTRGPVAAQRVPMAGAMQGPPSHSMGPNAPPPARPVTATPSVPVCQGCWIVLFMLAAVAET